MTVAIKVENLSKKYIIRHETKSASYDTFSESLIQDSKNHAYPVASQDNGKEITFSPNAPKCGTYIAQWCLQNYAGDRCFGRQPDRHGKNIGNYSANFDIISYPDYVQLSAIIE